ncbi:hypothetical protein VHEMI02146 [[Torrubiella] hemipterigena]|uniref:Major facilitator superfamily (MFS) profile domain-containing protein n=1 Tax=[Torrubiella] hemipterigena TaxID=1531966 RepID=A0A0A1T7A6_9HYPO|nr:hypothetical protein VHEMI02146 [[Torrubiella] hemipterigena]
MNDTKEKASHEENVGQLQVKGTPSILASKMEKTTTAVSQKAGDVLAPYDQIDTNKLLRKMDIRLIPMLALLYLLSFLDRGNIGNANVEGLSTTLGLTSTQYNLCLTVFFFGYSAFEVPSNLLLKKLRPSRWLPTIMIAWGVVMTLMGLVRDFKGLLIARVFLGIAEAGLFPGIAYYLTLWYCRDEIQLRQALFFSAASIAGAFSGLLAFAIGKMDGVGGLEGWRWIFILEGLATVIAAIAAIFLLFDLPDTAAFLTDEERQFILLRLRLQGQTKLASDEEARDGTLAVEAAAYEESFSWAYVRQALVDWQIWVSIILYWGVVCPLYGISLFLPTIIKGLGYTSSQAQLLTVPIYVTAAILAVAGAFAADKYRKRAMFLVICLCFMLLGFTMCISSDDPKVVYAGVFISVCAIYPAFPCVVTWLSNNLAGSWKRGAGMAIQIGVGNLGGAMASNFYRQADKPRYFLGHGLILGFVVAGLIATVVLVLGYRASNKKRAQQISNGSITSITSRQLALMGDKAPTFQYMY